MILSTIFNLRVALFIVFSTRYTKQKVSFTHSTVKNVHVLRNKFLSAN